MGDTKLRTTPAKRKVVMRDCLGPLAIKRPHKFASPSPGERMCKWCRARLAEMRYSPSVERPVRAVESDD